MKRIWYYISFALTIIGILAVTGVTAWGHVAFQSMKALIPMGWVVSITFVAYSVLDITWIILSKKDKFQNDISPKALKYIIIILQVFTFASIHLGIAISGLFK